MHLEFLVGTMIELPRAALTADQIAEAAEFFSFGTNDLTQTTWGFSRDDVEASFFSAYLEKGIFGISPFESIDRDGVGELVRIAVEQGPLHAPGPQARRLRRARRRPGQRALLRRGRAGLRLLLAVPGAGRPAGSGPGPHRPRGLSRTDRRVRAGRAVGRWTGSGRQVTSRRVPPPRPFATSADPSLEPRRNRDGPSGGASGVARRGVALPRREQVEQILDEFGLKHSLDDDGDLTVRWEKCSVFFFFYGERPRSCRPGSTSTGGSRWTTGPRSPCMLDEWNRTKLFPKAYTVLPDDGMVGICAEQCYDFEPASPGRS